MPSKKINHGILKKLHSGNRKKIVHYYQKKQVKDFVLSGQKGRGIEYGRLTDFNASSHYDQVPNQMKKDTVRHKDHVVSQAPAPAGHHEQKPHHLFRQHGARKDDEIVNN